MIGERWLRQGFSWYCQHLATSRHASLELIKIRFRYLFFFPGVFSSQELLSICHDLFGLYIKILDVVYGDFVGSEDKFIKPSHNLNFSYIHIFGILSEILKSPKFSGTFSKSLLFNFPELFSNPTDNIEQWYIQKPRYLKQLSIIKRDLVLNSPVGVKPDKFFRALFNLVHHELTIHEQNKQKVGIINLSNYVLPKSFGWKTVTVFSVGKYGELKFGTKHGQPCQIFHALTTANGQWVSKSDLLKITLTSDALRAVISGIRDLIESQGFSEVIGVVSSGNNQYRLAILINPPLSSD